MSDRTTGQARSHQHIQDVEKAKIIKYICKAKGVKDCIHANVCGLITVLDLTIRLWFHVTALPYFYLLVLKKQKDF